MKYLIPVAFIVLLTSCSAPKYTYRFPASHEQTAERKLVISEEKNPGQPQEILVASSDPAVAVAMTIPEKPKKNVPSVKEAVQVLKKAAMKTREEVRSVIAPDPSSLDEDLKMAILFGVVGVVSLVLLILSKFFGILGGIALIIGTVYFVKWVLAQ
ncbi:MAG: hypothetical protein ACO3FI_03240 [Cyclobacteriaceae bacterium]